MTIDFNCDVGEGILHEAGLFPYISSCNIACGGHFGTAKTIDDSIALAVQYKIKIGAHPSFPDQENFGRKLMQISDQKLTESLQVQMELFLERMEKVNQKLHHIKPHGALYNAIATDENLAEVFVSSVKKYLKKSYLYVPFESKIEKVALQNNINVKYEAFADRNYTKALTLVSRTQDNAVIHNPEEVFNHVFLILKESKVKSIEGEIISIKADTFCIHGDNKNAVAILQYLHQKLKDKGIAVK